MFIITLTCFVVEIHTTSTTRVTSPVYAAPLCTMQQTHSKMSLISMEATGIHWPDQMSLCQWQSRHYIAGPSILPASQCSHDSHHHNHHCVVLHHMSKAACNVQHQTLHTSALPSYACSTPAAHTHIHLPTPVVHLQYTHTHTPSYACSTPAVHTHIHLLTPVVHLQYTHTYTFLCL